MFEFFAYRSFDPTETISAYWKDNINAQTIILLMTVAISLLGSFLRTKLGWILTSHLLYFTLIYVIVINAFEYLLTIAITAAIITMLLLFMNSRSYYEGNKISRKELLTLNLLTIVLSMISNLAFSRVYLPLL